MTVITSPPTIEQEHQVLTGNSDVRLAMLEMIARNETAAKSNIPENEARKSLLVDLRHLVAVSERIKK